MAVKVLKETATREAEEDFMREVDIMSAFRHSNILSLIGVVLRGMVMLRGWLHTHTHTEGISETSRYMAQDSIKTSSFMAQGIVETPSFMAQITAETPRFMA